MAPVLPPNPVNVAIQRIRVEWALLAAPLDAILAKIERNDIVHEARAPPTMTLPHLAAMLSTAPPYDLRGCGPFYNEGEHSHDIPHSGTIDYTIAYRQWPTPDVTPTCLTLSLHWLPPPSLSAQSS
jgi:hypothetical protein